MSKSSNDFRDLASDAGERARTAHSDEEGHLQRKRQKALNDMADNQDWLEGKRQEKKVVRSM